MPHDDQPATLLPGWSVETVGGHPCDFYEPPVRNKLNVGLIYLHGVHLQRLVDNEVYTKLFALHGLPVAAPLTQRSWWTSRICAEFDAQYSAQRHLLERVLPAVSERWQIAPPLIGLFGTSMGGQGALKIAFQKPQVFPVVAAVSPAIDFHTRFNEGDATIPLMYADAEQARQDTAILHVHPLNWPRNLFFCCCPTDYRWHESAERLRMKLSSLGIPYECELELPGGGHGFGYYNRVAERVLAFLVERLGRETRRVK